MTEQLGLL